MVGVLFDTNIYGRIAEDNEESSVELVTEIAKDRENFVIHNFKVIRDELRKAPKILNLYDKLTCNTLIPLTKEIDNLAHLYFKEYRKNGGIQGNSNNFMNDLRIVACASIKGFNLVFSDDNKSMHNVIAIKSYQDINLKRNLRTPTFYKYQDLKRKYLNSQ